MRNLIMPTEEETLALLRYRLEDPQADVELEAKEYLASVQHGQNLSSETQFVSFQDKPTEFYSHSKDFFIDLMGNHLRLLHLLRRTAFLVGLARMIGAGTFADWGGGAGRDCIAMSRSGLAVTHLDVLGEGTILAMWRYAQRRLQVQIADALNPPNETFDIISNFDCMEHLEDPIGVLEQILQRLNPGGVLVLAVDFYNFDLSHPGPHLPKNFVYGGILQMALETIGLKKMYGQATPWIETATAALTVWQKPDDFNISETILTPNLRQLTHKLLSTFRGFYDEEIARMARFS